MPDAIREYFANVDLVDLLISVGLKLLVALAIFYAGRWVAALVQKALEKIMRRRGTDEVLVDFIGTVVRVAVIVVAVVAALDYLGVPATSLVAVVGAAGLAIGLALKDSLSNFAAGVMLVLFRPFTRGDQVDAGGQSGVIEEVYLVNTRMVTPDNRVVTVPNSAILNGPITNYSARGTRRVDLVVGVAFDDDLRTAAEVLRRVCSEHPKVLEQPPADIFISELGESRVNFVVRPWVKTADYWDVRAEVLLQAKQALEAAGCSIPFPQRDVHQYVYHPVEAGAED